jgi:hypothetical protein
MEPAQINPATADWQSALAKIGKAAKGLDNVFCVLQAGIPLIKAGTSFELNGVIYECTADETVLNWSSVGNNVRGYVTAIPDSGDTTAHFEFASGVLPALDYAKGGYYSGTRRYFFQFFKQSASATIALQNLSRIVNQIAITNVDLSDLQPGQIYLRVV